MLPALVAVAAMGSTYFLCLRPMRNGSRGMARPARGGESPESPVSPGVAELRRLREEVARLRADAPGSPSQSVGSGQ